MKCNICSVELTSDDYSLEWKRVGYCNRCFEFKQRIDSLEYSLQRKNDSIEAMNNLNHRMAEQLTACEDKFKYQRERADTFERLLIDVLQRIEVSE